MKKSIKNLNQLREAKNKERLDLIAKKSKLIKESFRETFNKIKRVDESDEVSKYIPQSGQDKGWYKEVDGKVRKLKYSYGYKGESQSIKLGKLMVGTNGEDRGKKFWHIGGVYYPEDYYRPIDNEDINESPIDIKEDWDGDSRAPWNEEPEPPIGEIIKDSLVITSETKFPLSDYPDEIEMYKEVINTPLQDIQRHDFDLFESDEWKVEFDDEYYNRYKVDLHTIVYGKDGYLKTENNVKLLKAILMARLKGMKTYEGEMKPYVIKLAQEWVNNGGKPFENNNDGFREPEDGPDYEWFG